MKTNVEIARECGVRPDYITPFFNKFVITFGTYQLEAYTAKIIEQDRAQRQAEPVAWAVYWGIGQMRKNSVHFERATAEEFASQIKSVTEIRPLFAAPPPAQVPEGYKLVPLEPTGAMLFAGDRPQGTGTRAGLTYAAMLAAAPDAPR